MPMNILTLNELGTFFVCRSPSDPDISIEGIAPFDLTPQTEFVVSDNFSSERKMLIQVIWSGQKS
jgi:hypothetical protein